jgi:hypothetical protein
MTPMERNHQLRRARGMALELIYEAFQKRRKAHDLLSLWSAMLDLGQDLGTDDVIFVLRQLRDRKLMSFDEDRVRRTNEVRISNIHITPEGCNLVEKETVDPAILIL